MSTRDTDSQVDRGKLATTFAAALGTLSVAYFINGLTQGSSRIPVLRELHHAEAWNHGNVSIAWTSGELGVVGLSGVHRVASENTAWAVAVLLIAVALGGLGARWRGHRASDRRPRRRGMPITLAAIAVLAVTPWTIARAMNLIAVQTLPSSWANIEVGIRTDLATLTSLAAVALSLLLTSLRESRVSSQTTPRSSRRSETDHA